jgi:acyl-CoA-dependent ceramide synthase
VQNLQGPLPVPDDWDHLTQPFRDPVGLVCWNNNIKWAFMWMLAALQVVLLVWFIMIVRVAYKVVTGKGAEDVRSDDEDEDEEEETIVHEEKPLIDNINTCIEPQPFLEREVLSTDPGFSVSKAASSPRKSKPKSKSSSSSLARTSSAGSSSSNSRKSYESAHASGINLLAGSSDRKELLGRIGCDKGSTSD